MTEKLDLDALEEIAGKARVNGKAYLKIFHAIVDPETVSAMLARIRELEATASPADQVEDARTKAKIREEVQLILTDPDSSLSQGAKRALKFIDAAMSATPPAAE